MSESDEPVCRDCFPVPAEIARLAENAQAGRSEPFVGRGLPDGVLACVHGQWRLGGVLDAAASPDDSGAACTELTKAGEPCKGRPGPDGLCAAHKGAGDAADPDQAPEENDGEEGGGTEEAQGAAPQDGEESGTGAEGH